MKHLILVLMLVVGMHGLKHKISKKFINFRKYRIAKEKRERALLEWMNVHSL